jgi:hypothetical protein
MRISARCILAVALALGTSSPAAAQQLRLWYVAPTATTVNAFGAANVSGAVADGYREVSLTAARLPAFQKVASANVRRTYDALQAGTALRRRLDRVLQISGGIVDVEVLLVDDATGFTGAVNMSTTTDAGGLVHSWPSASYATDQGNGRWLSTIALGDWASTDIQQRPGGWLAWESTMLHEMFHTQMLGSSTRWPRLDIAYGGDAKHWRSELLGDQEVPWEEGMGTYFGATHNDPAGLQDIMDFFGATDVRYLLESRSVLAGTSEIWNAPHTEEKRPVPANLPQVGSYLVRSYKWQDVPGQIVLFSESTSTAFHLLFWKYANGNRDQAFEMIFNVAHDVFKDRRQRFLACSVVRLALQLEDRAATPEGAAAKTAGTLTSSVYPFALLDLLTHFGMDRAAFEREVRSQNPSRLPRAYAEYWNHRDAIKKLVAGDLAANPMRVENAAIAIHRYCQQAATILTTDRP